jgi:hypothetical protein
MNLCEGKCQSLFADWHLYNRDVYKDVVRILIKNTE